MVVVTGEESKWYSCRVLYIGSAPPIETSEGIDAIQEPLNQRYPTDLSSVEGIDASLTVLPDRLMVRYMESGQVVEYPLSRLKICAAVRAVETIDGSTGEFRRKFVPVNQIECDENHPAVFSVIIRRSQGRQIQECHSFLCNSPRDALHLVNATATANMALKKGRTVGENTIVVQQNGYQSDGSRGPSYVSRGPATQPANEIIYVRSSTEEVAPRLEPQPVSSMEPLHYTLRQPEASSSKSDDVIYITFDKSNLIKTDEDTLQVKPGSYDYQTADRMTYVDIPPSPRPPPMVVEGPRYPPRAISAPVIVRAPPGRMMVGPPMPPPGMVVGPPPPRMYERRFMSPPPPRIVAQPSRAYVRSRAKSSSPRRYAASEVRTSRVTTEKYHPRWRSHNSDIASPPVNYMTRMNGNHRISRSQMGYYDHPPVFGAFYDRPVTKSNPKYSSSDSSSSGHTDNRYRRSRR